MKRMSSYVNLQMRSETCIVTIVFDSESWYGSDAGYVAGRLPLCDL